MASRMSYIYNAPRGNTAELQDIPQLCGISVISTDFFSEFGRARRTVSVGRVPSYSAVFFFSNDSIRKISLNNENLRSVQRGLCAESLVA